MYRARFSKKKHLFYVLNSLLPPTAAAIWTAESDGVSQRNGRRRQRELASGWPDYDILCLCTQSESGIKQYFKTCFGYLS
jgi:hypothetical protein